MGAPVLRLSRITTTAESCCLRVKNVEDGWLLIVGQAEKVHDSCLRKSLLTCGGAGKRKEGNVGSGAEVHSSTKTMFADAVSTPQRPVWGIWSTAARH